jgi:hypothetical protein
VFPDAEVVGVVSDPKSVQSGFVLYVPAAVEGVATGLSSMVAEEAGDGREAGSAWFGSLRASREEEQGVGGGDPPVAGGAHTVADSLSNPGNGDQ